MEGRGKRKGKKKTKGKRKRQPKFVEGMCSKSVEELHCIEPQLTVPKPPMTAMGLEMGRVIPTMMLPNLAHFDLFL